MLVDEVWSIGLVGQSHLSGYACDQRAAGDCAGAHLHAAALRTPWSGHPEQWYYKNEKARPVGGSRTGQVAAWRGESTATSATTLR